MNNFTFRAACAAARPLGKNARRHAQKFLLIDAIAKAACATLRFALLAGLALVLCALAAPDSSPP